MSSVDSNLKITPLHEVHLRAGAKMMPFGGWDMPVQYTGIIDEHQAVRNAVGVFDISHMGQVIVRGPKAKAWLNSLLTNNTDRLEIGECHYTFMLNEEGGVIDDLIVYRCGEEEFFLVINASMIEEDVEWMRSHLQDGVELENRSEEFAGIAIQGPKSPQLFDRFFGENHSRPARNEIKELECSFMKFYIARTGYTGEDGFEVFFPAEHAEQVWNSVMEKGSEFGIKPCGLGARDTLRLEMCYPLNGSDLSKARTPLEAGLSIFIDLQKENFIGRDVLLQQKQNGVQYRLVPFKMKDKSPPPRAHYPIFKNGEQIGEVNSGSLSPSLNIGIGMAYIPAQYARIGEEIEIDIRGRRFIATIEKKPLHRK